MIKAELNHLLGYEATEQIPQVLPEARLMYPLTPHEAAHEFLTFHYPFELTPTRRTPWFKAVPQLLKTPLL